MGLLNFKMMRANQNTNTTVANPTPAPKTEEPVVQEVDVMSLMGALKKDGQAKLSDHAKPVDAAPQTAPEPAPQEPKAEQKPQPKADKDTKKKATLIEPKDAHDALQQILALTKSGAITTTLSEDGKQRIFANAPEQNVLWTLRKCFRLLGGEHNGEKDDFKWTVPMEFLMDPNKAVATKSAKQQEYEQKVASGEIKPRTEQTASEQTAKGKGGKYTEEQVIKLMRMVNATLSEDACRVMLKAI